MIKSIPEHITKDRVLAALSTNRTFGIEFECFGDSESLVRKAEELGFTYSGDGSIRASHGSPIEIQTSVLTGKSGGEKVYDLLETAKASGMDVNSSCGTHVHLGGSSFFNVKKEVMVESLENITKKTVLIERAFYNSIIKNADSETANMTVFTSDEMTDGSVGTVRFNDERKSQYYKLPVTFSSRTLSLLVRATTLADKGIDVSRVIGGDFKLKIGSESKKTESEYIIPAKSLLVLKKGGKEERFNKLKAILSFYFLFEDVFFAMLPSDRETNRYCRKLSGSMTLDQIHRCDSQEDLEKLWYKTKSIKESEDMKTQHYSDSRYHAFNIHSLFYKYGTFEIRSHNGTLDADEILMWTALHQRIVDAFDSGLALSLDRIPRSSQTIPVLLDLLCTVLKLDNTKTGKDIKDYIIYKINQNNPSKLCAE